MELFMFSWQLKQTNFLNLIVLRLLSLLGLLKNMKIIYKTLMITYGVILEHIYTNLRRIRKAWIREELDTKSASLGPDGKVGGWLKVNEQIVTCVVYQLWTTEDVSGQPDRQQTAARV